jgi:aspartate racemase
MKRIGIVGGVAPASTVDYYEIIVDEYHRRYGDYNYPEIVIYSLSFGQVIEENYESGDRMVRAINDLHAAGVDFVIAACNSIHKVYDEVKDGVPIPWISIMEPAVKAVTDHGISKVGLVGTLYTMREGFFTRALRANGIAAVLPAEEHQLELNDLIFSEIVNLKISDRAVQLARQIVSGFRESGADGVVIACTELPYLFDTIESPPVHFNTTYLHAVYALDVALGVERFPR